jgi:hypothetical protein
MPAYNDLAAILHLVVVIHFLVLFLPTFSNPNNEAIDFLFVL